jgi:NAD(P)-dependent dehydrogenase (short-subunit alcohol dehydrogenase family)
MAVGKGIRPSFSLQGRVALITGASRGIGEEIAQVYSMAGAQVVICSRKEDSIEKAAGRIRKRGGKVLSLVANVSRSADRKKMVEAALDWAGRIDILVNNAGANPTYGRLEGLSKSAWNKVFEVNLGAPFFLSQLVFSSWMKANGGVILNISSIGSHESITGVNAYNVAKAALDHLTRCLAAEWGPRGVRVNALAPGLIKTQFSQALWDSSDTVKLFKGHPIPRIGEVEDISGAALFLASGASSYITGHILAIDGGQLLLNAHDLYRQVKGNSVKSD